MLVLLGVAVTAEAGVPARLPDQTLTPSPELSGGFGTDVAVDGDTALVLSTYAAVDEYRRDAQGQ